MERATTHTLRCLRTGTALARYSNRPVGTRAIASCSLEHAARNGYRCCATRRLGSMAAPGSAIAGPKLALNLVAGVHTQLGRKERRRNEKRWYGTGSSVRGTIGEGEEGVKGEAEGQLEAPAHLDEKERQIWDLLTGELECSALVVQDISGGCGSMYGIDIESERFRGLNMLKQQRLVNEVLGDLIKGWHGMQLKTRVPTS